MAKENILLPAMSDQMSEAELLSWKVSIGDKVNKGDMINVGEPVAEIETEEDSLLGSIFD